jgi:DNA-binding GntR family transcriptional regulator
MPSPSLHSLWRCQTLVLGASVSTTHAKMRMQVNHKRPARQTIEGEPTKPLGDAHTEEPMIRRNDAKDSSLKTILGRFKGAGHRRASSDIHQYLRDRILANIIPPDTILSQVEVAALLKVSRTPVREALRMLQEEGLVGAEPNCRCRVLGFNPQELEALYVCRIANEGISAAMTAERMSDEALARLSALLQELKNDERSGRFPRWIENHRRFHELLFSGATLILRRRMSQDCRRSERYVYNAKQCGMVEIFRRAAAEHEQIVDACRSRQPALVVEILTRHLARAGIDIIAELAPYWEPKTLRTAARLLLSGASNYDARTASGHDTECEQRDRGCSVAVIAASS